MLGNFDPNSLRFGYDTVGAIPTPLMTGGASNPVGSYFQAAAPALSGSTAMAGTTAIPGVQIPQVGGAGQTPWQGLGLGNNLGTWNLALGGLQTIGNLWAAWNANKLAKEQFSFQKDMANTNLANQTQAYNTTLEDRIRSRAFTEGQTAEQAQSYIDQHRLPTRQ